MTSSATDQLHQLLNDEWEFHLKEDPLFATEAGDHRYDDRLPSMTEADFQRRLDQARNFGIAPRKSIERSCRDQISSTLIFFAAPSRTRSPNWSIASI